MTKSFGDYLKIIMIIIVIILFIVFLIYFLQAVAYLEAPVDINLINKDGIVYFEWIPGKKPDVVNKNGSTVRYQLQYYFGNNENLIELLKTPYGVTTTPVLNPANDETLKVGNKKMIIGTIQAISTQAFPSPLKSFTLEST